MQVQADIIPIFNDAKAHSAGFNAACNILDKWRLSLTQKLAVLRLPKATYYKYSKDLNKVHLDRDQLARISYLLNIHASLRTVFTNRDNIYGFMTMENHNSFFNGRTPLGVIESGDIIDLYEVSRRIDNLRGGQW